MINARLAAAFAGLALFSASAAEAGQVWLSMDRAKRHQLDAPAGRVVVTNPAIADVQVLSSTEMLLFPRMPGNTDILFFSAAGERIESLRVKVASDGSGTLTLQNGAQRFTFVCTQRCEQTPALGDGPLQPPQALMALAQQMAGASAQTPTLREEAVRVTAPAAPQAAPSDEPGS